ncbi:MAG: hypothetical protein RIS86_675 [Planctomycetota bacterium]|jgi:hypothetical protein
MRAMDTRPTRDGSDGVPSAAGDRGLAPATPPAAPSVARKAGDAAPPRAARSCLGTALALGVAGASLVYLANPTLGVFELLPDNVPVVGNLDEAFFTAALISALGYLGLRLPFVAGPRR